MGYVRSSILAWLIVASACHLPMLAAVEPIDYRIELTSPIKLFDGKYSWCHPRSGTIPPRAPGNDSDLPLVVMTIQRIELSGSDTFDGLKTMRTGDLGRTWQGPVENVGFGRRPFQESLEITVCDFTPGWHALTGKLLGTGQTVVYENNKVKEIRPRVPAYSFYDAVERVWSPWQGLQMPDHPRFANTGAGSAQRFDLENGDILLPVYFKPMTDKQYSTTVVRCRVEQNALRYIEHGNELTIPVDRGLFEPSVTRWRGRFFLTMRNDQRGYVSTSNDGLQYSKPKVWTWDDGSELGNYNTQQHWVNHSDGLFLVYTRRGANNDHVMRNRAPLFIAQIDPDKLFVIRSTERELMPNRGARLGNFAVNEVSPHETWVTDAEWMQPAGCERYGSDGSVWVSKIHWQKPNANVR